MTSRSCSKTKITFFVTVDWYFCLHWLPLAVAIKDAGYAVSVITRVTEHGRQILDSGLDLIPIELSRSGKHPLRELRSLWRLFAILRREQPDILHNIAQKPALYGTLAGLLGGVPRIVNTVAGMGYVFTSTSSQARLLRPAFRMAYRLLFNRPRVRIIVQNPDDAALLSQNAGIQRARITLIRGVGVDLERFTPSPEQPGPVVVTLASRLVWDKGVQEFVDAARLLGSRGVDAHFRLVGKPDRENPAAISEDDLRRWVAEGSVEWTGFRSDMTTVLAESHIICLPSYREGLPTILIEAAAAGRPMVTTDVPGCREVVRHGENGLLVPVNDANALADAIGKLVRESATRESFGRRSREIAEAELGSQRIVEQTLEVYRAKVKAKPHS